MPDDRTFIKVHDGMPDHPKIEPLSDAAFRLLITMWCWSSRHLTDGRIPEVSWSKRGTAKARAELVTAGLVVAEHGGYRMHDYLKHQRSAADVAELKEKRREAGKKGGQAKANALALAKQKPKQNASKHVAETETDTEELEVSNSSGPPRRRERPPDPTWDALLVACGIDAGSLTTPQRGATNKAAAELRGVHATPDDIKTRAVAYRRTFPNAALTPSALVKHWASLNGTPPDTSTPPYYERLR